MASSTILSIICWQKEQEEEIESDKVEQKDKEGYEKIKAIKSGLESVYKELKITIAARDDEKPWRILLIH